MLMNKIISFLTGGQSDFLIPLSHQWHGINVAPLLYAVAFLGAFAAVTLFGVGCWRAVKHHPFAVPLLLAVIFATAAYAASSTLSGLSAGSAISDTDLFYDVQSVGSGGVKVTGAQLKTYFLGTSTNGQILKNNSGAPGGITPAIATGCGATGGTIGNSLSGTIAASESTNAQTASYALQSSDCGKLVTMNDASSNTLTLNNFSAGNYVDVLNIGAGTMTLTAGVGSISGGPSSLTQNQGAKIVYDGTNWHVQAGASSGGGSSTLSLAAYYFTGQWYPFFTFDTVANNTANANTMYCYFGVVATNVTIKALGAYVVTGVSGNAQFAIYKQDGSTPGQFDLVDSTGNVSTASSALAISATVGNTTDALTAGTLYAQCANNSGGATFQAWSPISGVTSAMGNATINAGASAYQLSETLGTWPSTFTFSSLTAIQAARTPQLWFQVN